MISIVWLRRDLRLEDNTALNQALKSGNKVLPIFIFDEEILAELPKDDARVSFIHETLQSIVEKLQKIGGGIQTYHGHPLDIWKQILETHDVSKVYFNRDYEPYALQRDAEIMSYLEGQGAAVYTFKDQVIFEKGEVVKKDGKPYTVYTPYKNKWLEHYKEIKPQTIQLEADLLVKGTGVLPLEELGFKTSAIKVKPYALDHLKEYAEVRDIPSKDGTSYLSPHLRFGTISVRQVIEKIGGVNSVFASELIWREFFMQILYHFPQVVHQSFRPKYDQIQWRNDEAEFEKWCKGETGYPMVDAGMRQLNETGYMHNRVRMVVASFLCKHLLIDWRWGEAYFAEKLLDYELSSNNGNWQWAAGTGCDAAPYFRVFNPTSQLEKFDKNLLYVKQWVKEFNTFEYPTPIVDHKAARVRALECYKQGLN